MDCLRFLSSLEQNAAENKTKRKKKKHSNNQSGEEEQTDREKAKLTSLQTCLCGAARVANAGGGWRFAGDGELALHCKHPESRREGKLGVILMADSLPSWHQGEDASPPSVSAFVVAVMHLALGVTFVICGAV